MHCRWDGPEQAPVLVLGPSRNANLHLWDGVVAHLEQCWRVLRFDLPTSPSTAAVADDVLAVLRERGVDRFVYCGVSSSAAVGLHFAVHLAESLDRLAIVGDAAAIGEPARWAEQARWVQSFLADHTDGLPAANIAVPTVVIAGVDDAIRQPEVAGEFAACLPAELLEVIVTPWHPSRIRQPEAFARLISRVLLGD